MDGDEHGGGVDDMGFNEAELLYMAAPKQMVVGGMYFVLKKARLKTVVFRAINRTKLIILPFCTSVLCRQPDWRRQYPHAGLGRRQSFGQRCPPG